MKAVICALLTVSMLLPCTAASSAATPQDLTLPTHALVLTMLERGLTYDAGDAHFVWLAAYYALTLSAPGDAQARLAGDHLILPADRLVPVLRQLFSRILPLPVRPGQLDSTITLSPDKTQLLLSAGDPGQTQLVWLSCQGTVWQVALISPDANTPLCHAQVTLNRSSTAIESCIIIEQLPQTHGSEAVVISGYGHRRTD